MNAADTVLFLMALAVGYALGWLFIPPFWFTKRGVLTLVDRLLHMEEINGDGVCPTYMYRWTLLKLWGGRGLYVHHFVGDDWSRDLHDHPKRFVSIGLRGQYIEELPPRNELHDYPGRLFADCGCSLQKIAFGLCDAYSNRSRVYRAPWIRTFPATHRHRIRLIDGKDCWTLVVVLKTTRSWGFWVPSGTFVPWRRYVSSERAQEAKSCP